MQDTQSIESEIQASIEPVLQAEGYELVLLEFIPRSQVLRLFIDKTSGIGVEDCSHVSRLLGDLLDAEGFSDRIPGNYTFEVSSPGLDRPLVKANDFLRFLGEEIKVTTKIPIEGRRRYKGQLVNADQSQFTVEVDGKEYAINYEDVERARLVPQL